MSESKMKVMPIFGTRPEVIKMAPVINELRRRPAQVDVVTCATAQHRDMLDQAVDIWKIVLDVDLNIMRDGQSPSQVAARVLARLEPVLMKERPDWILVQGDTTSVMAAAIAAYHLHIKIGHVEAGLRTHDKWNPFPEEMNRVLTTRLAALHFAPTKTAAARLREEGIQDDRIFVSGNTGIDAVLAVRDQLVSGKLRSAALPALDSSKKLWISSCLDKITNAVQRGDG